MRAEHYWNIVTEFIVTGISIKIPPEFHIRGTNKVESSIIPDGIPYIFLVK